MVQYLTVSTFEHQFFCVMLKDKNKKTGEKEWFAYSRYKEHKYPYSNAKQKPEKENTRNQ